MAEDRVQRRLAAILAADAAGYSRLMGEDESGTVALLKTLRSNVLDAKLEEHGGRIVNTAGDGLLMEFPSAVGALEYAIDAQQALALHNEAIPEDRRIHFRMGINLGDVIVDGEEIYGDGVNIAARLGGFAEPGEICISGIVHESVRGKLEVEFSDAGDQSFKNIAAPVHVYRVASQAPQTEEAPGTSSDTFFLRPAVAVLPFENLSRDPEQEYFTDGLTEEIITQLSKWRSFPVIARNSTFAYKGKSPDIRQVGRELGARYVIEGSVRTAGSRVRVTAQLINADTGHHVWAERYDRDLEDIFELQDQLTQHIAATVMPQLDRTESTYATSKKPRNLSAWDYHQRGWALLKEYRQTEIATAREMFEKSIELDPTYSRPYTGLANVCLREMRALTGEERAARGDEAIASGQRAVELDPTDSEAHQFLGISLQWDGQFDRATAAVERAVDLNPSNPGALATLGHQLALAGRAKEGLPYLEKGLRLMPLDAQLPHYQTFMARSFLFARENAQAVEWARRAVNTRSDVPEYQLVLASCLAHAGNLEGAHFALSECERLQPGYASSPENWQQVKLKADMEYFLDGLRKAGLSN